MKDIVVIYHGECPDGFGAAWAAHKKLGDSADYIGVHHNTRYSPELAGKTVYMLDFAYPEEQTKQLMTLVKRLIILDHHVTMEPVIKLAHEYRYALDNSGSVLSWNYFHPGQPLPKMLKYIEDRDIWKHEFPETDSICAFIDSYDFDFKVWDQLILEMEDDAKRDEYARSGDLMLTHEKQLMKDLVRENAKLVMFEGHEVYCVNAPYFFADHVGHMLYTEKPPMAIMWNEDKKSIHVSLRSDGTVDVAKIAEKFGGGGHKGSAGFILPAVGIFPWTNVIKKDE